MAKAVGTVIARLLHDGSAIEAPAGTTQCVQVYGRAPMHGDWVHDLFAADNPGPVQLITQCGQRAHRFVLPDADMPTTCPDCVGIRREEARAALVALNEMEQRASSGGYDYTANDVDRWVTTIRKGLYR